MYPVFWWNDDDINIVLRGTPVTGPVEYFTDVADSLAIPNPSTLIPAVQTLGAYQSYTFKAIVEQFWKRMDIFISTTLVPVQYPMMVAFDTSEGIEGIRSLVVSVPMLPSVAGRRVVLDIVDHLAGSFSAVEFTSLVDYDMPVEVELQLAGGSVVSIGTVVLRAADDWEVVTLDLPSGIASSQIDKVRLGPTTVPSHNIQWRLGRVSLLYAINPIPKPVLGTVGG